jgi:dTDP-4-amino-4,6-dideoxygalactose transaminase
LAKLAIHGGKRVNTEGHVEWPIVTEREKKAVMKVLDSRIFWGHYAPQVVALQNEWAQFVGARHCLATGSGTAALHIACAAAGVGPGDEVITTALTFVASALGVLHHNGIPVFVDVDPRTFNIDVGKIEARITEKTKAIMPVHLHGVPADMDEINAIAKKHKLIVIEDACQAQGSLYKGRRTGILGHMAAFSLNGSKNLPGGEGGLFTTDNEELRHKADMVRALGEDIVEGAERDYNAFVIGWMYRYQEMAAAFVRARLKCLDRENARRRENAEYLSKKLERFPGVTPPWVPPDRTSVYHLYRIRLTPEDLGVTIPAKQFRRKVQKALRAEGLQANEWHNRPVPLQSLFQNRNGYGSGCPWTCPFGKGAAVTYKPEDYPVAQRILDDSIVLHSAIYPPNGRKLMGKYVEAFDKLWENLDEVLDVTLD